MNGHPFHKAVPRGAEPVCRFCGREVKRVAGGTDRSGWTWVHAETGCVAAVDPPIIAFADHFATHDPDVEWPSDKHDDPVDAICAALDRLREERDRD
jgi:hypothetical protein